MQVLKAGIYVVDPVEGYITRLNFDRVRVHLTSDVYIEVRLMPKELGVELRAAGGPSPQLSVHPATSNLIFVQPQVWHGKKKRHLPLLEVELNNLPEAWRAKASRRR